MDENWGITSPQEDSGAALPEPKCDACDDTGIFNESQDSMHVEHKPVPCPFCCLQSDAAGDGNAE